MALSADKLRNRRGNGTMTKVVIGTGATIFVGSLAARVTSSARGIAASAATTRRVLGVVDNFTVNGSVDADGVGDTAGTESMDVAYGYEYEFTVATAIRTNTSLGLRVFVADDDEVAGTAVGSAGVRVVAGTLVAWVDETGTSKATGWVKMLGFTSTNIAV